MKQHRLWCQQFVIIDSKRLLILGFSSMDNVLNHTNMLFCLKLLKILVSLGVAWSHFRGLSSFSSHSLQMDSFSQDTRISHEVHLNSPWGSGPIPAASSNYDPLIGTPTTWFLAHVSAEAKHRITSRLIVETYCFDVSVLRCYTHTHTHLFVTWACSQFRLAKWAWCNLYEPILRLNLVALSRLDFWQASNPWSSRGETW